VTTTITKLPFFGGTLSGFDPSDNGAIETTTANTYDTTYATCSLTTGTSPSTLTSPKWPVASTFWGRFFNAIVGIPSGHPLYTAVQYLHTGTVVAQIQIAFVAGDPLNTFHFYFQSAVGGTLTNLFSFARLPVLNPFDFNIVAGASGSVSVYSNNTLLYQSGTLDHSSFAGIDQMVLTGGGVSGPTQFYYSEVCCDTVSTVSRRVRYDRLNTNSAVNTGWTGGVTNINEIPTSDNSPLFATVTNLTSTFFENGLNLGSFTPIIARGVSARFRTQATNPPAQKLVIRAGSTNFLSARIAANAGYQASFNCWTSNPHTSALWTATNAASSENGIYSSG
jgi:hypothetical protein